MTSPCTPACRMAKRHRPCCPCHGHAQQAHLSQAPLELLPGGSVPACCVLLAVMYCCVLGEGGRGVCPVSPPPPPLYTHTVGQIGEVMPVSAHPSLLLSGLSRGRHRPRQR